MSLVKPIVWIIVLGGIGYFAYTTFNKPPASDNANNGEWGTTPQIQLGPANGGAANPTQVAGGMAPNYAPITPVQQLSPPSGAPNLPPPTPPGMNTFASPNNNANNANALNAPPVTSGGNSSTTPNAVAAKSPYGPYGESSTGLEPKTGAPQTSQGNLPPLTPYTIPDRNAAPPVAPPTTTSNAPPVGPPGTLRDTLIQTRPLEAARKFAEVLRLLTPWYDDSRLTPEADTSLNELLDKLAGEVIYSRQHFLAPAYVVKPGDRIEEIAARYKVPPELLININGITDPTALQPGTELKVMNGPFTGVVNASKHTFTLYVQDCYAGRFPIGIGTQAAKLDVTSFVVGACAPQWTGPTPDPSKAFWVDLDPQIQNTDHATLHCSSEPDRPNRDGTPGCYSLAPQDARDVYGILSVGSRVTVRR